MTGDDFENTLSGILFADRERSREEMLDRARYLADLEAAVELRGNKEKIVKSYREIVSRLEDLMSEVSP